MSELSSDSSQESYSSDDSTYDEVRHSSNINDFISWNSIEGNLSNFSETFKQYSCDEKIFLLKSRCLITDCSCNFKSQNILLAKVFVGLKVLIGKWCKLRFSKCTLPDTDKIATFIFFKEFKDWYEIMNENLEVIPSWSNVNQVIQNKPKSFILRKDSKCLIVKDNIDDPDGPTVFESALLKSGTVLLFSQSRKYSMKKGRRIKEQNLVKCTDSKGSSFYFSPDDTIYSSPIAGLDNLSGAHAFNTIIEKFHFPINVKPIFMTPPFPNLPCSDRHFLQLTERFQMNLIFVTPLNNPDRLFLITPDLFDDHVFTVGEFLPQSITKIVLPRAIDQNTTALRSKIDKFFSKCHKFENLSYLLKHAQDISKCPPKFEISDSEFDETYIEVEGIYFFIRNGFFPRNSVQIKSKIEKSPAIESEHASETSDSSNDDDDESTDISSTSTDSDKTSSTAMNKFRKRRNQAKSVPNWNSKNKIENAQYNTSNSRGNLEEEVPIHEPEGYCHENKRITNVPKFYRSPLMAIDKHKGSGLFIGSLKDTMV